MGLADRLDRYNETHTYPDGTVIRLAIFRTESDAYPSGWRYTLHYGRLDPTSAETLPDGTILRYDNAHEAIKGHECHRGELGEAEQVVFPGIVAVWHRFWEEVPKEPFGPGSEG